MSNQPPPSDLIRIGALGGRGQPAGVPKTEILGLISESIDKQWLDIDLSEVTFSNTAAEFDLYNIVIQGGVLGALNTVVAELEAFVLNNDAAVHTITFRIRYGATTLASVADSMAQSVAWRYAQATCLLQGNGATNAQRVRFGTVLESTDTILGTMAVDSTVPQTFRATGQFDLANANLQCLIGFKRLYAVHSI